MESSLIAAAGEDWSMERRWLNARKIFLRHTLPLFRLFPLQSATRLVSGVGRLEYRLQTGLRKSFDQAVSKGRDILQGDWDLRATSRELAGNHILWRARDLLLDGATDEQVRSIFHVTGREHLDAALGQGKGCLVLASHFGAHMLPAHWMYREKYPLRLYMERPRSISKFMARQFQDDGPLSQDKLFISRKSDPADSASSILRAGRALKSGMILFLAGDVRWEGKLTAEAQFLGRTFQFSTTWVVLAATSGSPVVVSFCQMGADGKYHLEFRPAFQVPRDASTPEGMKFWVRHYLSLLEDQVRHYPSNSNDYFFWDGIGDQAA
jgi:KDO2-lipid IV(A) lauroyltransferase